MMLPGSLFGRARERLRRFAHASDLAMLRRVFFTALLVVSGLASLNGAFGHTQASFDPSASPALRIMLAVWAGLHIPFYLLARRRAELAYFAYVFLAFVVLAIIFDNLRYPAMERIGLQFAYHGALVFLALMWLPFGKFVLFSSVTTVLQMAMAYSVLSEEPVEKLVGVSIPLFIHWFPSLLAATLLERHYRGILESQDNLRKHKENLEKEVEARTKVIEDQQRGLHQAEKLQAVGQLAGGIAHDFGNVLEGVILAANTIARAPEKTDRVMRAARLIERASRRGAELTSQILNFARGGRGHRRPVAMDAVVRDVTELLQRTLDSSVTLRTELGAGDATVLADPGQMQQVVMNLALNARDAMPHGGKLELTTDVVHLDGTEGSLALPTEPGEYVRVVVSDEGVGIPEAVRSRMFEPFFTTKQGGRNAGMGLATVYGIVKALGGQVSCESEEGRGTRFSLHLPASSETEDEPRDTKSAAPASAGRYGILLVEDDADVRSMAAGCLSDAGHGVVEAEDGLEGLARFKESTSGFDLVVLDLSMPRMGGEECLLAIRKLEPDTRFLLTTGFLVEGGLAEEVESGKLACLRKPYDEARLLTSIDEIMGAARSERPVGQVEATH